VGFIKIGEVRAVFYLNAKKNFYLYFPHFCPIWVKFGRRDLEVKLLSACEFHEKRQKEGLTCLKGVNETTLTRVPQNRMMCGI
jgi:hypothetical protein